MIENPRLRLLVGRWGRQIAVALAVVAVVALVGAGWVAASAPTETVTQKAHEQTVVTETSTSAVVTGTDALWPRGTVLSDNPVYLLNATPVVHLNATTRVLGTEEATVSHTVRVTVEATRDGEQFYSETRTVADETASGSVVHTNATIDVAAIAERAGAVQEEVGTAGVVTARLSLDTTYDTGRYANETTASAPLRIGGTSYAVGDGLADRERHSETVTTEVTQPPDETLLSALVGVALVAGLAAAVVFRQNPEEIDMEAAKVDLHRRQFAQWISPGRIPMGTNKEFIELDSLEALVDAAIDTEERVVHDERRDLYAAFSENVVYHYSPGGGWMETMFPQLDTSGGPGSESSSPFGDGPGVAGDGLPDESTDGSDESQFGMGVGEDERDGDRT